MASQTQAGMTLIELMVAVTIATVVTALALPSFQSSIEKNQMTTQANTLLTALNLARSESVKRDQQVTVCARNEAGDDCATSAVWKSGWLVFVDSSSNGIWDSGEEIVRVYDPLAPQFSLVPTRRDHNSIGFLPTGRTTVTTTFVMCRGERRIGSRVINLFATGRVQLGRDTNGNQIPETPDGSDVSSCGLVG